MSARGRILALRLMEKQAKTPQLMERMGVEIKMKSADAPQKEEKDSPC